MFRFDATDLPAHRPPRDKSTWPSGSELRTKFGRSMLWWPTSEGGFHMSKEELEPYRLIGDGELDHILNVFRTQGNPIGPADDLLLLAEEAERTDESQRTKAQSALVLFVSKYKSLPSWVDRDQLTRGQEVFLAYTPVASLSLYYRSLVAGFSIPKIAAVIQSTAYLAPPSRPDQALQRLLDTGELNASCMGLGVESILPDGIGWKTALHVRVLHAKIRQALLRRKGDGTWDVHKYGIPINQEDMAATLLAFSVNVLDGIDLIAGVPVKKQERLDYLALWRYIGWLLGVETEDDKRTDTEPSTNELPPLDPCGPGKGLRADASIHSAALLDSIVEHLLHPDESSVVISHHLLKITDRKPPSMKVSEIPTDFYENELFYFRSLQCRRLIGDPLADALHLPIHPRFWKRTKLWLKSAFFLKLFRCYTLATMWVPVFRRIVVRWHSKATVGFHENWMKTHKSKMAKALVAREKASCLKEDDESQITESTAEILNDSSQTLCPFAMVAPPQ